MTLFEATRGDAITLARCWRVERRDGTVQGFTDHDEPIAFDGTTYLAATGLDATEADSSLGLNVDDAEVTGVLDASAITERDLAAGRYDGAEVRLYVVDWTDPSFHSWTATYLIGEVVRADAAFRAELRGLSELLEVPTARRFTRACDARFGDERCGVDVSPDLRVAVRVVGASHRTVVVDAVTDHLLARLPFGRASWTSADGDRIVARIADARPIEGGVEIGLWSQPRTPFEIGAEIEIEAGCDKSLATCTGLYANAINFRGFAHLPTSDFAYGYASGGEVHDGEPLVR